VNRVDDDDDMLKFELLRELTKVGCEVVVVKSYANSLRGAESFLRSQQLVEPGYNDIGLCDTSPIATDILWYQLIPHC
jgi:hypothetical protein